MLRKRLAAPTLVCMAVALVCAGPADAAKKRRAKAPCAVKGSKTVKRSGDVRIFTEAGTGPGGDARQEYFGCLTSHPDPVSLGAEDIDDFDGGTEIRAVRIAGRQVGVLEVTDAGCARIAQCPASDLDGISAKVTVTDLRRARTLHTVDLDGPPAAFAVTRRGGLAVLAKGVLSAADGSGVRQLDAGTIDGRTLRAEISIVSWVRDGVERFARLR